MQRTLLFKLIITLVISFFSSNGQPCPCSINNNVVQCNVTSSSSTVNIGTCYYSNGYSSINIIYSGNVTLSLTSSSTNPIVVKPIDGSGNNILQISYINTQASLIEIQIYLSSNQVLSPLFTPSSSIIASTSTLSINVIQNITDASNFKIFDIPSSTSMNFANYKVIFDTSNTNSGVRKLYQLIIFLQYFFFLFS
jgi:hypothetical protein